MLKFVYPKTTSLKSRHFEKSFTTENLVALIKLALIRYTNLCALRAMVLGLQERGTFFP